MQNVQQTFIGGILKVELRSRVLRRLYYDHTRRRLALEMRTGGLRIYGDVPPSVTEEIIAHAAPGGVVPRTSENCARPADLTF
jgi:hypothetical protein